MNQLQWIKLRVQQLTPLSEETGLSVFQLLLSYEKCKFLHGATFDQFLELPLYSYSNYELSKFLSVGRQRKLKDKYFNLGAQEQDYSVFDNKHNFMEAFRDYVHRDWVYLPESSPEDVRAFAERNPDFLIKTDVGTCGIGISLNHSDGFDPDRFWEEHHTEPLLLDGYIHQHPDMAALNPSSVNTVRIVTARYNGQVMIVGTALRCGGAGSHLDNFHSGGVAYPVDLETGIVSGPGRHQADQRTFLRHPSTGRIVPGFQIPNWNILLEQVQKAASYPTSLSKVGYMGWDVAVTPEGIALIEGNAYPMPALIQMDGSGVYKKLTDFIASATETAP